MEIRKSGERKLIEKIWRIFGEKNEDEDVHFLYLGDKYLLLAVDTINERYHFDRSWNPGSIGKFLVDINLSDIAAKNGKPLEMMVSFSFPRELEERWVTKMVSGIKRELKKYNVKFSGGDLKESDRISLTGMVIGEVQKGKEFRRSGARPGDYVYISAKIGRNERAIIDYYRGKSTKPERIIEITPRLDLLGKLGTLKITSCIDNSDGIYKSLGLLSKMSGVMIRIVRDVSENSRNEEEREAIYAMGGDYELIFTSPQKLSDFPLIGKVMKGKGVVDINGKAKIPDGFDHFRSTPRRVKNSSGEKGDYKKWKKLLD
ncbi:MAG: Thiamine-monophosphate kinase [Thermoplasmatales archaeon I-plasma]|jgi:thiamine-monophosphate kinase|nr:MAG: Thiamine-monophosphate kinase [Thermoplasmatales archaeon I-plasma]